MTNDHFFSPWNTFIVDFFFLPFLHYFLHIHCVGCPQDHSHVWWFTRKTHRTQPVVIVLFAMIYTIKRCKKKKISKRETYIETTAAESECRFPRVISYTVTPDVLKSSSIKLWQYMWNVIEQGSSSGTQGPKFLLRLVK